MRSARYGCVLVILVWAVLLSSAVMVSAEQMVRVGLFRARQVDSLQVECGPGIGMGLSRVPTLSGSQTITLRAQSSRVLVTAGVSRKSIPEVIVHGKNGEPIRLIAGTSSIKVRGSVSVRARKGQLLIVNNVGLEDYVRGVVAGEVRSGWPRECLKAQAIIARTLAVSRSSAHRADGFGVCDTTHCQIYRGAGGETSATNAAAATTRGLIISCASGVVEPFYCSTCGGASASGFGNKRVSNAPYLSVRRDLLNGATACKVSPHYAWRSVISTRDMLAALRTDRRTDPGRQLSNLRVLRRDSAGRGLFVEIKGERIREVDAYIFQNIVCRKLGWAKVKSAWFDVTKTKTGFEFRGHGLGHGLGLCQWGAKKRAEAGWDYRRILRYYYHGCSLVCVPSRSRV